MSAGIQLADIVLPAEIGDDFAVQDITSQIVSQNTWQPAPGNGIGRYSHTGDVSILHQDTPAELTSAFDYKYLPASTSFQPCFVSQSTTGIQLTAAAEDSVPQTDLSSQLVQLIRSSATFGDSLARAPVIELLKHQAEQVPATAYQQTIPVWQLTGQMPSTVFAFCYAICT